jgi:hypothetical protein
MADSDFPKDAKEAIEAAFSKATADAFLLTLDRILAGTESFAEAARDEFQRSLKIAMQFKQMALKALDES